MDRMGTRKISGAVIGFAVIIVNVALVALVVVSTSSRGWSGLLGDDLSGAGPTPTPTSAPPSATQDPEPSTDETPETVSPTPTTLEPPEPDPVVSLEELYEDGEDLTVVVLGDQTGSDPADWVLAWARLLAGERTVEVYSTSTSDPTVYSEPELLGQGESNVVIYNGSHIGNTPGYTADRLGALLPEDPDVVMLNFGRSNDADDITDELEELWDDLVEVGIDTRVVIQPPRRDGLPPLDELTREWAEDVDADTVDVAGAFIDEGIVDYTVSTRDPLSVNLYGADRWAQIVQSDLFGSNE